MKTTPLAQPQARRSATGFTLIELLVVVAIIALLAAGSVGAYGKFIASVKEKSTQKNCVEIAGAISSFYRDYDTLPITSSGSDSEGNTEDPFIAVIVGAEESKPLKNPRHINYLDGFKQSKRDPKAQNTNQMSDGIDYTDPVSPNIYDSWGQPFKFVMDTDFNDQITNPIVSDAVKIIRGKRAIIYSTGRPGEGGAPNTNEANFIRSW